jgi:putative spermidine/putrescine transport system permease protein
MKRKRLSLFQSNWLLVIPSCLWIFLFLVLPLAFILIASFWKFTGFSTIHTFTLENYLNISRVDLRILINTLEYSIIVIVLSLVFCYPAVYFLTFHIKTTRVKIALFLFLMIPFWTSYLIRTMAWYPWLARDTGLINSFLTGTGILAEPVGWLLYSKFGTIIVMLQLNILMMLGPIFFSLSKIDKSIIEAAKDLGAPFWRIFRNIIFPLSLPGVAIGSTFVFVLTMGDFATPAFIGGGKSTTVTAQIYNDLISVNIPAASVKAVILFLVMVVGVWLIFRWVDIRKEL